MKKLALALTALAAFSGSAVAADLPARTYTKAPVIADSGYNWTGFYVGGDVGGAWTSNTGTFSPLPSPIDFGIFGISASNGGSGIIGGFHAGYNWQFTPTWIAGIEGDWSRSKARGSFSQVMSFDPPPGILANSFVNMSSTLDWLASIRGRLGYLVMPNLLAYGTGGAAWGKFDYAANDSNGFSGGASYTTSAAVSSTQSGYVVGGGLEWAITNNWLLRGEYLYYRLNSAPNVVAQSANLTFQSSPSGYSWSSTNVSVARAGLSYKF
ncbi:outer membrane beta-barrel protein [Bradyrhizobium sp.]|uniref:outer membrane protein n=1 Tax=Bradyrhizobium sp. TaxID=376 RepID=UPI0025BDF6EF|nr:outer membrane beta-barrel protein [Bradyrhizobium sp.]